MFTNLDSPPVQILSQVRPNNLRIQRTQSSVGQNSASEMNEALLNQFRLTFAVLAVTCGTVDERIVSAYKVGAGEVFLRFFGDRTQEKQDGEAVSNLASLELDARSPILSVAVARRVLNGWVTIVWRVCSGCDGLLKSSGCDGLLNSCGELLNRCGMDAEYCAPVQLVDDSGDGFLNGCGVRCIKAVEFGVRVAELRSIGNASRGPERGLGMVERRQV